MISGNTINLPKCSDDDSPAKNGYSNLSTTTLIADETDTLNNDDSVPIQKRVNGKRRELCDKKCSLKLRALQKRFDEYRNQASLTIATLQAQVADLYEMCTGRPLSSATEVD